MQEVIQLRPMSHERIVTIGGGKGAPTVNRALLKTQQVDFITSIAAVSDSGGASGRRRLDSYGTEIAYSDAIRILLSLIDPDEPNVPAVHVIEKWLLKRDSRDNALGQEIFNQFFDRQYGFQEIITDIRNLNIGIKGTVLPSTTEPTHINFRTESGRHYKGEHELDLHRMSQDMVVQMWLDGNVQAFPKAAEAITAASKIILSCGSLYGSVLCNFLPEGMRGAMRQSEAKKFLVTNLVSTRNENHNFSPIDFIDLVETYSGVRIDGLIVPEYSRVDFETKEPEVANTYAKDGSYFLGWNETEIQQAEREGIQMVTHNATSIVPVPERNSYIVRHDPDKLAQGITTILSTT